MVYGRKVDGRTLELEASGALRDAALVMRDRQTDSWWSLMSSDAIGGPLKGTRLEELPVGEKTTWGEWRKAHPETLVLSIDGVEHLARNPYDPYYDSPETFRNIASADDRLPPKEPIFALRHAGRAWAVPHRVAEGGALLNLPQAGVKLLLFREPGASVFASTEAWLVEPGAAAGKTIDALRRAAKSSDPGIAPVADGFDTFWYTWVAAHRDTRLLQP